MCKVYFKLDKDSNFICMMPAGYGPLKDKGGPIKFKKIELRAEENGRVLIITDEKDREILITPFKTQIIIDTMPLNLNEITEL